MGIRQKPLSDTIERPVSDREDCLRHVPNRRPASPWLPYLQLQKLSSAVQPPFSHPFCIQILRKSSLPANGRAWDFPIRNRQLPPPGGAYKFWYKVFPALKCLPEAFSKDSHKVLFFLPEGLFSQESSPKELLLQKDS